jgi:hypothetical protein
MGPGLRRDDVDGWYTAATLTSRHHPRKRVIQYSREADDNREAAAYWIPAFAGMTSVVGGDAGATH